MVIPKRFLAWFALVIGGVVLGRYLPPFFSIQASLPFTIPEGCIPIGELAGPKKNNSNIFVRCTIKEKIVFLAILTPDSAVFSSPARIE